VRGARAALFALGLAGLACDLGPLGGTPLRGERVAELVTDWSFLADRYALEIETVAPSLLPSATTWFVVHEGTLWLYTMLPPPFELPWVRRLRDVDPGVRIRVDGKPAVDGAAAAALLQESRGRLRYGPADTLTWRSGESDAAARAAAVKNVLRRLAGTC